VIIADQKAKGRPKKRAAELRRARFPLRLTDEEYRRVRAFAERAGLSLSEAARRAVLAAASA
jgi:hypothetical protein